MIHITHDRREKIDGAFERMVRDLLRRTFDHDEFFTLAEVAKYKPSESFDTWEQNAGRKPQVVEVYHKGEFICDVDETMTRDQMMYKVVGIWRAKMKEKLEKEKGVSP